MPQNCSTDVIKVIEYMDGILQSNDTTAKQTLKAKFGLEGVEHDDDFMSVLENGPWQWQSNDFYTGYSSFYEFCDSVENVGPLFSNASVIPGAEGVGLEKALEGYAKWIKEDVIPGCKNAFCVSPSEGLMTDIFWGITDCASYGYEDWTDDYDLGCFDTYNSSSPFYVDLTVDNPIDRQWEWFLCNEPYVHCHSLARATSSYANELY